MKLQDLTGLTNADPLHVYLGIIDRVVGECDWSDITISQEKFIEAIWMCLGHPIQYPTVEEYCLDNFEHFLQQNNDLMFIEILKKLRQRPDMIDLNSIRTIIMWLGANLDSLKEKYLEQGNCRRQITGTWQVSADES